MKRAARIAVVVLAIVAVGCSSYRKDRHLECLCLSLHPLQIAGYSFDPTSCPGSCPFLAGASREDITPPAGFPMGGSGPAGRFGRGYWTRLYARAFYFRGVNGTSLALVSCDLAAVSSGLQMEVASLLHRKGVNLTSENLILAATHVHHGPGNFMTFSLYNKQGSPAAGWDKELFNWLAEKISNAVVLAKTNAESVSKDTQTELVLREGTVEGLLRNRAPEPFMLNADRDEVLNEVPKPSRCPRPFRADCPRFRAVDNRLSVLQIQRSKAGEGPVPAAALVFLSVHPEAMSHDTALYQSDFTGLAMAAIEKRDGIVAGFFNGADGDISVRWHRQNRAEALDFSDFLVKAIDATQKKPPENGIQIVVARKEISSNPYRVPSIGDKPRYCVDQKEPCLAREPLFGVAAAGGAEDARTPLFDLGWKPGVRGNPEADQGVKLPAFTSPLIPGFKFTHLVANSCDYPETIPLGLVTLRGAKLTLSFAVLPAELTRTAWRRIEKALASEPVPLDGRILPVGPANEYGSYVTTREEYAAQGYEGASNTFGPFTAEVIQAELIGLKKTLGPPRATVEKALFFPGKPLSREESFGPESLGFRHGDPDEALEPLLADSGGLTQRHVPRFAWVEPGIKDDKPAGSGIKDGIKDYEAAGRRVEIVPYPSGAQTDDDKGPNLLTVFVNPSDEVNPPAKKATAYGKPAPSYGSPVPRPRTETSADRCWMAIWLPPAGVDDNQQYVFSVTPFKHAEIRSTPFTVGAIRNDPPHTLPRADEPLDRKCH